MPTPAPFVRAGVAALLAFVPAARSLSAGEAPRTWTADNGNGTYTNPLFYDEFSDPDLIRVGEDFYLTGTTMHAMPGLPILHSRDLVNWSLLAYASDRLDLAPAFRLQGGRDIYGQGIWAPTFRYHQGAFYIFTNVNGQSTQLFRATDPAGPWTRTAMKRSFHDLSVLFDDDGKVYVIWGYQDLHLAELNSDLTDMVPGTERVIIRKGAGMGEGVHFYKIDGRYYILSAWYEGRMRMPCARSDSPLGPYEVNPAISTDEDFGLAEGNRLNGRFPPFTVNPPNTRPDGRMSLHQGGIVATAQGEWWGWSMMDANSVGRLTCLSPVTWKDGWPWFGLPGNLQRTPRTWVKPATGHDSPPSAPYQRNDDFSGPALANVWQWNHVPDDAQWSLAERPGHLRLHALPAADFWTARNTLTQRAIGPVSSPTAELDASGLKPGDLAGLGLLNAPYATLGVARAASGDGYVLRQFDQRTGATAELPLPGPRVWLRAHCDFLAETATFHYSTDGRVFAPIGPAFTTIFQLRTFQGVRYSLFAYHTGSGPAGQADFNGFTLDEPLPRGLMRPIPFGRPISLRARGRDAALPLAGAETLLVIDRGLGRVALRTADGRYLSVEAPGGPGQVTLHEGEPADAETWQWTETVYGDLILMSLVTHRHLRVDPATGGLVANHPGPLPDRKDGSCFDWSIAAP